MIKTGEFDISDSLLEDIFKWGNSSHLERVSMLTATQSWSGKITAKEFIEDDLLSYANTPTSCMPDMNYIRKLLANINEDVIALIHNHPMENPFYERTTENNNMWLYALPSATDLIAFSHHSRHDAYKGKKILQGVCPPMMFAIYEDLTSHESSSPFPALAKLFQPQPVFNPAYAMKTPDYVLDQTPRVRQVYAASFQPGIYPTEPYTNRSEDPDCPIVWPVSEKNLLSPEQIRELM